jgi:hypothetical protein
VSWAQRKTGRQVTNKPQSEDQGKELITQLNLIPNKGRAIFKYTCAEYANSEFD